MAGGKRIICKESCCHVTVSTAYQRWPVLIRDMRGEKLAAERPS